MLVMQVHHTKTDRQAGRARPGLNIIDKQTTVLQISTDWWQQEYNLSLIDKI